MNIYQLLPLLDGWEIEYREIRQNFTISGGDRRKIQANEVDGWIDYVLVNATDQNIQIDLGYGDAVGTEIRENYEASHMVSLAHVAPNPTDAYLSKYDDNFQDHVIVVGGASPKPFKGQYSIHLVASGGDTDIDDYSHRIIEITDPAAFRNSLRDLYPVPAAPSPDPSPTPGNGTTGTTREPACTAPAPGTLGGDGGV